MRLMEIPRFPRTLEIRDRESLFSLFSARLRRAVVMWPDQAIPLVGYMCQPNNPEAREDLQHTIWRWGDPSREGPATVPKGLGLVEREWNRVSDIFHLY